MGPFEGVVVVCSNCGAQNPLGAKFCNECATRLSVACSACAAANSPTAKFCSECAAPLGTTAASTGSAAEAVDASAAAATGSGAAVAQRRLVSILFTDLVGFTALVQDRDPEETRDLLTRYFEMASEIIGRYGGVVEKFIGDAVMAVWGAPTAHEDDAERAVRAAMDLVSAVATLGDGVSARAGVLTGEAAVTIGATNQGMVAGDLVNTASRLQSVAPPGTVLVGETTQRAAAAAIAFEPAGEQLLKGRTTPVPAYRALRVVAEVGGRNRSEGLEAPFVGRDDELRLLKDLFHATGRERRTRLLSVTGQAGIGKSRLAWEFEKYLDGVVETVWWHQGRSPAYGQGITFWALGEMVRSRAGLVETDDPATTRVKVAASVTRWVPDEGQRRWIESALLALLGAGEAPAGGRDELFAAWRTYFERIAAEGPVALVFQDLHWADAGLLDFIDHLLEWSRGAPIYILTLARPELLERRPDWGAGKRNFMSISLESLDAAAMRRLLAGLVPGLPEPTAQAIIGRADGVPLYAVETVRMLVAEGRLREQDGAYVPVGDLSALAVPETLQALIAARLDALEPADRLLLQDASVLGQTFSVGALAAVTSSEAASLEPRLRGLVRRELLVLEADTRSSERGQYAFVQALVREVAYNTLSRPDRKVRHLAAARYFETLGTDELAGALATHYAAAYRNAAEGAESEALAAQARIALRAAAERAAALGSHEQAVAFLEQALDVTTDAVEAGQILERAASSALEAARYSVAEGFLRQALERYGSVGDRDATLRATAQLGRVLMIDGRTEPAAALLMAAVPTEGFAGDTAAAASLFAALARVTARSGDARAAMAWADRALELAEPREDVPIVAEAVLAKASVLNQADRRFEAAMVLDGLIRFAEVHSLTAVALEARNLFAYVIWDDDLQLAYSTARTGMDHAARVGDRLWWVRLLIGSSAIGFTMGEWGWVAEACDDAQLGPLEAWDQVRIGRYRTRLGLYRGRDVDEAVRDLIVLAGDRTDPMAGATANWMEAERALLQGDFDRAYVAAMAMVDIVTAIGTDAYPLAARAALWAGDLERARLVLAAQTASLAHGRWPEADRVATRAGVAALEGRRADAVNGYRDAIGRYRVLGMTFELARVLGDAAVMLGSGDPDGSAAAREAREVLGRLGASAYVERLESLLATGPAEARASTGARGDGGPSDVTQPRTASLSQG